MENSKKFFFTSFLFFLAATATSCSDWPNQLDRFSFKYLGGTLINNADQVSMKEVHLDSGNLLGKSVIINGIVVSKGEHGTYIVVADESARMLIVLADIPEAGELLANKAVSAVSILGTVERGKRGLPFIMAKALISAARPAPLS